MLRSVLVLITFIFLTPLASGQQTSLEYYLPDANLDRSIPTPEEVLGFPVGKWHLSHDQLVRYLGVLAESSDRIKYREYARSYEDRPLILLTISSPDNLDNLEEIRTTHLRNMDPMVGAPSIEEAPVVVYQGFSVHGNEPSGANAAVLLAYYLAAAKGRDVERLLRGTVILLDPCFNPDGFHRFSSWVNMHRSAVGNADPQSREFNEVWPGGRTNHYWFDLNRDWLLVQHPESQGRLKIFHNWKPNVLTDHHEMGTNSTFFFQPGVPQRTNPITPERNQELTAQIGNYHAEALDEIGSMYYSQENFDDFYYGKGSTYPDVNGSVGILFEQASSRGHVQESRNGLVHFPFTIKNQLTTALSTLTASFAMRSELLEYQRHFYLDARGEASTDPRKAFIFGEPHDQNRLRAFTEVLQRHSIEVYELSQDVSLDGTSYVPGSACIVPLDQDQYRLIRTIFEPTEEFRDSIFYDVSAWTLPMAYNMEYGEMRQGSFRSNLLGDLISEDSWMGISEPEYSEYAYLLEWDDDQAPRVVYSLLDAGLRLKVAMEPFQTVNRSFDRGTILIPVSIQDLDPEALHELVRSTSLANQVQIHAEDTGLTPVGIDLGSNRFAALELPEILVVSGSGSYSYEVGEYWHLLENRYGIPVSLIDCAQLKNSDLSRYSVIIMAHGSYNTVNGMALEKIKTWLRNGGTLVCQRGAVNWAINKEISRAHLKASEDAEEDGEWPAYSDLRADFGSKVIGGAILQAQGDLTHPLLFGIKRPLLPMFRRGSIFLDPTNNPYASPLRYTSEPVLSGYVHSENETALQNSPAIVVNGFGSGKVISVCDNLNFRAYWYGTSKITANAIFFGHLIGGGALESE